MLWQATYCIIRIWVVQPAVLDSTAVMCKGAAFDNTLATYSVCMCRSVSPSGFAVPWSYMSDRLRQLLRFRLPLRRDLL
jgi:hypothetical protein